MAAGKGERLRPLTLETPKPLVKVNGKVIIEGLIETLLSRGIEDIVLVVGYLSEKFAYLKEKYGVKLIYNKDFASANNISSLYYARNELTDCVILDGDQIIKDPTTIEKQFSFSGYACRFCGVYSSEWMMDVGEDGKILSCDRQGGENKWELKSLSYWTKADAEKLAGLVKLEYESGNRGIYWDDVAMFVHSGEFQLYAHKIADGEITEIDSVDELIEADGSYAYLKG